MSNGEGGRPSTARHEGTPLVAFTIAGSDSSGGAGIQADLRTFAALGVHGASAITALTAQNTTGVDAVHVPPVEFLLAQVDAVLADLRVAAVKTGMLATADVVCRVAEVAARGLLPNLVVDPVMVASSGARLLEPAAETAYLEHLLPHALVVTPNVAEASVLLGRPVRGGDDYIGELIGAARDLHRRAGQLVVIKGGDLAGRRALDVVYDGRTVRVLAAPRVAGGNNHGAGCTFSAAIAAHLAHGRTPSEAVDAAKAFVHRALLGAAAWHVGHGPGPLDHLGWDTGPTQEDLP